MVHKMYNSYEVIPSVTSQELYILYIYIYIYKTNNIFTKNIIDDLHRVTSQELHILYVYITNSIFTKNIINDLHQSLWYDSLKSFMFGIVRFKQVT